MNVSVMVEIRSRQSKIHHLIVFLESIIQFSDGEAHNDPILKCYMNCMFHEYLIVDDNGEFHMDKVKAKLPPSVREVAFRLLDACFNVHTDGETQCDRAHLLHLCWKKTDPYVCTQVVNNV